MPEGKVNLVGITFGLLAMAFAVGFFGALFTVGDSGVLYRAALRWELAKALIALASWAPAILLAASALALESSEADDGFAGSASKLLVPALALAAAASLFYLLALPAVERRREVYETQGRYFAGSLEQARQALSTGDLALAGRLLVDCRAIDGADERVIELDAKLKLARSKEADAEAREALMRAASAPAASSESNWEKANAFYLDALKAEAEGRLFEAHYLAKRSAEMYPKRPEVSRLVENTWSRLERSARSAESKEAEAFYRRKLEGYARFQERDYLAAYSIFKELTGRDGSDPDVAVYLGESAAGLERIAFFVQEAERAFAASPDRGLDLSVRGPDGAAYSLKADKAAAFTDAVYMSGVVLESSGAGAFRLRTPFARLHGHELTLRSVDRASPERVYEPVVESGSAPRPAYIVQAPFGQDDAEAILSLSGDPSDIPIAALVKGLGDAGRLGTPVRPLLVEFAARSAYPFTSLMLVLLGAALGIRFKPSKPPRPVATYLSAPLLVALAVPPLGLVGGLGDLAARVLAATVPAPAFAPAWLGFLAACVVATLFVSAAIANKPRSR